MLKACQYMVDLVSKVKGQEENGAEIDE